MRTVGTATFLPLTTDAAQRLGQLTGDAPTRGNAMLLRQRAVQTEAAARTCWTALLAGCDSTGRACLTPRLRALSEATSVCVGTRWWFVDGAAHRHRVACAQSDIEEAVADADGQEFAMAFVGYDHAMASAVVCAFALPHEQQERAEL